MFIVKNFGCVLVLKILVLARIIIAATQIVKIDKEEDIMSDEERVVSILYGPLFSIRAEYIHVNEISVSRVIHM